MSYKLIPPGARKGNLYWIVRGHLGGRRYEYSTKSADEPAARSLADRFENDLAAEQAEPARPVPDATGFVYFIGTDDGRVKIGYSTDPEARLVALQTGAAGRLSLIAKMPGRYEDEKNLHIRFGRHRLRGEWFRHAGDLRNFIAALHA